MPAARPLQKKEHLAILVEGLCRSAEAYCCEPTDGAVVPGLEGQRLRVKHLASGETKEVDVFECYYSDLMPDLSGANAMVRLWEGTKLLSFWLFSRVWWATRGNFHLVVTAVVSSVILVAWYSSVFVLGCKAIGEIRAAESGALVQGLVDLAKAIGEFVGPWVIWLGVGSFTALVRGEFLANISNLLRRYLQSAEVQASYRERLRGPLLRIVGSGQYSRVTVLAHSFGTIVALDVMGGWHVSGAPKLHVITIGSPLRVLRRVGKWLDPELKRCAANKGIACWHDFSSDTDWMGSEFPMPEPRVFPFSCSHIENLGGFWARFSGATHREYFYRHEVLDFVLQ